MDKKEKGTEARENLPEPEIQSLQDLIDHVMGRNLAETAPPVQAVLHPHNRVFPFTSLVGLEEVKLGLIFSLISPNINSILIIGPPNTGKTTAVRSLVELFPPWEESLCIHGCLPEHIEQDGMQAVCPDCAKKYGEGLPISRSHRFGIIEIPADITLSELSGKKHREQNKQNSFIKEDPLFSRANGNILFTPDILNLPQKVLKSILNSSQSGVFTYSHYPETQSLQTNFTFIAELDLPEKLIDIPFLDSFDLVIRAGTPEQSLERKKIRENQKRFSGNSPNTQNHPGDEEDFRGFTEDIFAAKNLLNKVSLANHLEKALRLLLHSLDIKAIKAENLLIETARASAAADFRENVNVTDIKSSALITLRQYILKTMPCLTDADELIREKLFLIFPE